MKRDPTQPQTTEEKPRCGVDRTVINIGGALELPAYTECRNPECPGPILTMIGAICDLTGDKL